jgi:hypothetical protein
MWVWSRWLVSIYYVLVSCIHMMLVYNTIEKSLWSWSMFWLVFLRFWCFKEFWKILDVNNDVFYGHSKSHSEIICILAYTKMTNTGNIRVFKFWTIHYCLRSIIMSVSARVSVPRIMDRREYPRFRIVILTQPGLYNIFLWIFAHR